MINLLTLIGFGYGTTLTIILLSLSIQKRHKRFDDYAFGVALLTGVLWFSGNFFSLLLSMLFGTVTETASSIADLLAALGLTFLPSALVHVHLAILFRSKKQDNRALSRFQVGSLILLYIPGLIFILLALPILLQVGLYVLTARQALIYPFTGWLLFAIGVSVYLSEKLVRILENEADRHFHRVLSLSLAGIGLGLLIVYIIPLFRLAYVGKYLNLVMLLSPSLPMSVLLYYVYRYNFYRLVVKPSMIYSIIYGLVMAIYLVGIRRFGEYLSQFPEVNSQFVEGILLVALVFVFQPFRTKIQTRLDKLFFKDKYHYQQYLRELSDSISEIVDLQRLLKTLGDALTTSLKAKAYSLVVFRMGENKPQRYKTYGNHELNDIKSLIDSLQITKHYRLRRQMRDYRVVRCLLQNQIELAIPIYFQDTLSGLVCLTEKKNGNAYSDDELDVLQTFANQIGLAFENARLVQDRLELEARIYQSEKLTSLGLMATTIAHEVKNPLSSIKTIVQVLHENAKGEDAKDLSIVISEINRLNSVLEKLLSFARTSENRLEPIDMTTVIKEILDLVKHQARKSNVKITFNTVDNIPSILAKKQNVREIAFNLVFNAIQAMYNGGELKISLQLKPKLDRRDIEEGKLLSIVNNEWVQLTVHDNGPGMSREQLKKIFDPFYTSKSVGTGLGLAIVKRNIQEMGGYLNVHSEKEKGAEFIVSLPVNSKNE